MNVLETHKKCTASSFLFSVFLAHRMTFRQSGEFFRFSGFIYFDLFYLSYLFCPYWGSHTLRKKKNEPIQTSFPLNTKWGNKTNKRKEMKECFWRSINKKTRKYLIRRKQITIKLSISQRWPWLFKSLPMLITLNVYIIEFHKRWCSMAS